VSSTFKVKVTALTAGAAAQQQASPPDFSSGNAGWLTFFVDFSIVPGGTGPLRNDPAHPRVSNQEAAATGKQPNYFIADLSNNTVLKSWVVERMKKDNAEALAGKIGFTPHSSCMPAGVPVALIPANSPRASTNLPQTRVGTPGTSPLRRRSMM
jgi:hypothetical protein